MNGLILTLLLAGVGAPMHVGVAWSYPEKQAPCFRAAREALERAVEARGYALEDTPDANGVWLDVQVGWERESERIARNAAAPAPAPQTYLWAQVGELAAHDVVGSVTCGPELEHAVITKALILIDDGARVAHGEDRQGAWQPEPQPTSYIARWQTRFRGEAQPVELGIFGVLPGSNELTVGVSARTNASMYGLSAALGPDIGFWHGHGSTVWEPALTAGVHAGSRIGSRLAWSWGVEVGALLDIWSTPGANGVKFAGRLGVPFKFGVNYNHAMLTVMPYLRTGGLDLEVDGVSAYHAEIWGVLARIAWGMGGRH